MNTFRRVEISCCNRQGRSFEPNAKMLKDILGIGLKSLRRLYVVRFSSDPEKILPTTMAPLTIIEIVPPWPSR